MNIRDIAHKAGVSVATISRAINPQTREKLSPKTLKLVDEVIHKYGYTPNLSARNLNKSSTKTIGILFPYFYSIFFQRYYLDILGGIADALINTEYQFKILLTKENAPSYDRYDFKKGESVDGLLITHWPMFFKDKMSLEKMNIPFVLLNDFDKGIKVNFASADQEMGGAKAAEHLYNLGHRHFAVVLGSVGSIDGELRFKGFSDYLKKKKITIDERWMLRADYREDFAYERIERVIADRNDRPSAIFCLNDRMAQGVLRRIKELNINCPKDISVIGFDNDPLAKESNPPLTTLSIPLYDMAQESVRQILTSLKSKHEIKASSKKLFPVQLVTRASTAAPLK